MFIGILGILAGLIVIRHPLWSAALLPVMVVILLGIQGLVQGVVKLIQTFQGAGGGAVLLGILNLLFGELLLSSPLIAALVFPLSLASAHWLEASVSSWPRCGCAVL